MNLPPSSPPEGSHEDPGRNWRQSTPAPPSKKPWWRLYGATLTIALCGLIQTTHHYWFVRSNPPPRFEELQSQRIEVLSWYYLHPQLHVRLMSGETRMVEFPTLSMRRATYWEISKDEQKRLVGKTCQMWGRPLRFSVQDSYQVFALSCTDRQGLSFDMAIKQYVQTFEYAKSAALIIYFPLYLFGCALFFWAETIRNRKSLQKIES